MSVGGVVRSPSDPHARSQEADVLQAQSFHRMLAVERDALRTELAKHAELNSDARAAENHWVMRHERGVMRKLENERRQVTALLCAMKNRFDVAKD